MRRPLLWVFSSFVIGILLFRVLYEEPTSGFERSSPRDVVVTGVIERLEEKENTQALHVKRVTIRFLDDTDETVDQILLYCSKEHSFRIGNQIMAAGSLSKFSRPTNPGQFDEASYYQSKGFSYKMFADSVTVTNDSHSRIREGLRSLRIRLGRVYQNLLGEKEAGVVAAMILGEKAELNEEVRELYGRNGMAHVLAISGLHVSLIGMAFFGLLMKLKCHLCFASGAAIVFLLAYGEMTGFGVATSRAVFMLLLSFLANMVGRTYDSQTAMSLAGCILLGVNPLVLFQSGFLLSYGAVAGILFVLPVFQSIMPNVREKPSASWLTSVAFHSLHSVLTGFLSSLAVSVATFPVLCYFFYEIPVYSIILNLVVIPCMGVLIILSLLGGAVGLVSVFCGQFLIGGVPLILGIYETLCVWAMELPVHTIVTGEPKSYRLIAYYAVLFGVCFLWRQTKDHTIKKAAYAAVCVLLPFLLLFPSDTRGTLQVTMLDVGQGDGIFIRMPEGTTIFIDGGSSDTKGLGRYRIEPFLKNRGLNRLDYVIVTHADGDHTSGIMETMERMKINGIRIENLVLANTNLVDGEYEALRELALEKGIKFIRMESGTLLREKEAYMKCLHPDPDFIAESRNDYSLVYRLTYKEFDMLLTGDVENEGESLLIDKDDHPTNGYEVLKVAHHGSRNSTGERFLEVCKPNVALISCGWNNRYGHPHEELLDRLEDCGSVGITTIDHGAVTIQTDGAKVAAESFVNGNLGEWDCKE